MTVSKAAVIVLVIWAVGIFAERAMAQDKGWVIPQPEYMSDMQVCTNSVTYSLKFMQTNDARELHQAVWRILSDDRLDDAQKLIAMVVFHTAQEVSWRIADMGETIKTKEDLDNYISKVESKSRTECEYALNRLRFPDGEIK